MTLHRFVRLPILAVLTLFMLLPASSSYARKPDSFLVPINDTYVFPLCASPVVQHVEGTLKVTIHYDRAGNPTFEIATQPVIVTNTNTETGKSLSSIGAAMIKHSYQDGTTTTAGLYYRFVAPGQGVIFIETGRIVYDAAGNVSFEAGPHMLADGDVTTLCAYLAAP
jgi:hypothetical protein